MDSDYIQPIHWFVFNSYTSASIVLHWSSHVVACGGIGLLTLLVPQSYPFLYFYHLKPNTSNTFKIWRGIGEFSIFFERKNEPDSFGLCGFSKMSVRAELRGQRRKTKTPPPSPARLKMSWSAPSWYEPAWTPTQAPWHLIPDTFMVVDNIAVSRCLPIQASLQARHLESDPSMNPLWHRVAVFNPLRHHTGPWCWLHPYPNLRN